MVVRFRGLSSESVSFTRHYSLQITRGCKRPPEQKGAVPDAARGVAAPLFNVLSLYVRVWYTTRGFSVTLFSLWHVTLLCASPMCSVLAMPSY